MGASRALAFCGMCSMMAVGTGGGGGSSMACCARAMLVVAVVAACAPAVRAEDVVDGVAKDYKGAPVPHTWAWCGARAMGCVCGSACCSRAC